MKNFRKNFIFKIKNSDNLLLYRLKTLNKYNIIINLEQKFISTASYYLNSYYFTKLINYLQPIYLKVT